MEGVYRAELWIGCRKQSCGEKWSESKGGLWRGCIEKSCVENRRQPKVDLLDCFLRPPKTSDVMSG